MLLMSHEMCSLFSDSSVVWVGGFSTETQTKPYHLWLNPAGPSRANGDKTIDTPLSTLLFVKYMLFFSIVVSQSQISVGGQNEPYWVMLKILLCKKRLVSGKYLGRAFLKKLYENNSKDGVRNILLWKLEMTRAWVKHCSYQNEREVNKPFFCKTE